MGSSGMQLGAVVILIIGTLLAVFATVSNEWSKSDVSDQVLESVRRSWGLWKRCQRISAGLDTCDHYDRLILGSPVELILSRAFMLIGIMIAVASISLMLVGADCSTLLKEPAKKKKLRCVSGVLGCVAGALVLLTGILIAIIIVQDFHAQNYFVTQSNTGIATGGSRWGRAADGDDAGGAALTDESLEKLLAAVPTSECDENGENCEVVFPKSTTSKGERFGNSNMRGGSNGDTMVFGAGVMLAWGSGVIILIAGAIMLSQGCGGSTYEEEHGDYGTADYSQPKNQYPPTQQTRNNEYL